MRSLIPLALLASLVAGLGTARADIVITQGGDWTVSGHVAVTACVLGHCSSARDSAESTLFLPAGSIVQVELQVWDCGTVALDDYCTAIPGRGDRTQLRRCDKSSLGPIIRGCSPYPSLRLRRIGGVERSADDGQSFQWRTTFGFTLRVQGHTATVSVGVRTNGTLAAAGVTSEASAAARGAPGLDRLVARAVGAALAR